MPSMAVSFTRTPPYSWWSRISVARTEGARKERPSGSTVAVQTSRKTAATALGRRIAVAQEVQRVCRELGLRDWSKITKPEVSPEEARIILAEVNTAGMAIPLEVFCSGLEVELEHGTQFKDANVTNNHPLLTGKIVLAHLKESMDYYQRLEVAEIEGDILKAVIAKNPAKLEALQRKLARAKLALCQEETAKLG